MRLMEGVSIYQLSSNVGTSIEMIENYYGHLRNRDPNVVSEITKTSFTDNPSSKVVYFYAALWSVFTPPLTSCSISSL